MQSLCIGKCRKDIQLFKSYFFIIFIHKLFFKLALPNRCANFAAFPLLQIFNAYFLFFPFSDSTGPAIKVRDADTPPPPCAKENQNLFGNNGLFMGSRIAQKIIIGLIRFSRNMILKWGGGERGGQLHVNPALTRSWRT